MYIRNTYTYIFNDVASRGNLFSRDVENVKIPQVVLA